MLNKSRKVTESWRFQPEKHRGGLKGLLYQLLRVKKVHYSCLRRRGRMGSDVIRVCEILMSGYAVKRWRAKTAVSKFNHNISPAPSTSRHHHPTHLIVGVFISLSLGCLQSSNPLSLLGSRCACQIPCARLLSVSAERRCASLALPDCDSRAQQQKS
jgi:hypothetical protein